MSHFVDSGLDLFYFIFCLYDRIAFPGQRAAELVQPLVQLSRSPLSLSCDALVLTLFYTVSFVLDLTTQWTNIILRERNGLMMFEAAMAMTNLASINDDLR